MVQKSKMIVANPAQRAGRFESHDRNPNTFILAIHPCAEAQGVLAYVLTI